MDNKENELHVIKRNGSIEKINFNTIQKRLKKLADMEPKLNINTDKLTIDTINRIKNNITTTELDKYSAELAMDKSVHNYEYQILASRICISNHQKNTTSDFGNKIKELKEYNDNMINDKFYDFVTKHKKIINNEIKYERDYLIDYFGFKTLEKTYLFGKIINGKKIILERPQDLFMRISIAIHLPADEKYDIEETIGCIKETYFCISNKYFIHASPTLFNAGTKYEQLSSCFVLGVDDSLESIMKLLTSSGMISKFGGGIGFSFSSIRSTGSLIRGTNGLSNGIIPFIKLFNSLACAVDQGGKRLGSFAVYLEPHHADIFNFLDLRKNLGDEKLRARDISIGLWISDLFMEILKKTGTWYLMDPNECPGLDNVYGDEYNKLYTKYVNDKKYVREIKITDLWKKIYESVTETGYPYICYKDQINRTSNQKNIGIIKNSNLCTEIMEVSSNEIYSVCNLASICLPSFIIKNHKNNTMYFDYLALARIVRIVTRNLNKIININYYPVIETKKTNLDTRPIGIGVQGLTEVFYEFKYIFGSKEAIELDKKIFETIYYAALSESTNLAKQYGTYKYYHGSDLSKGIFQWESYNMTRKKDEDKIYPSNLWNWDSLRNNIKQYGVINSLVCAVMPTASTSQILAFNECIESPPSHLYKRKTLAGEFIVINKYLMSDLRKLDLLNENIISQIQFNNGSIQNINNIPNNIKELYKTSYEIKTKCVIDHARVRQAFIDQSQSLNLYITDFSYDKFCSIHIYGHEKGLKTGSYYTRINKMVMPRKITTEITNNTDNKVVENNKLITFKILDDTQNDICLLCSS